MKKTTFLKTMLLLCALVVGSTSVWAQTYKWVKTAPTDLQSGDIIVLVDQTSKKAMDNTSLNSIKAPNGTDVTLNSDKTEITSEVTSWQQWTITVSGTGDSRTYQLVKGTDYLYVTATNNGVRVGAGERNTFKITSGGNNSGYYLTNKANESGSEVTRYIGCYSETDWRCYTSINSNINDNNNAFYRKVAAACFGAGKTMISFSDAKNALDFTDANRPTGLNAYQVTAADASSVTLAEVTSTVAKNTGLILTGTASTTYKIPIVTSGTDISGSNLLVATDGISTVSDAAVLSGGEFHPLTSGVIAAGKAYLPYDNIEGGDPFAGGARGLDIVFEDEVVTGIKAIENLSFTFGDFYDLQGRKVAQPKKGLYIVNGKKVIIK